MSMIHLARTFEDVDYLYHNIQYVIAYYLVEYAYIIMKLEKNAVPFDDRRQYSEIIMSEARTHDDIELIVLSVLNFKTSL